MFRTRITGKVCNQDFKWLNLSLADLHAEDWVLKGMSLLKTSKLIFCNLKKGLKENKKIRSKIKDLALNWPIDFALELESQFFSQCSQRSNMLCTCLHPWRCRIAQHLENSFAYPRQPYRCQNRRSCNYELVWGYMQPVKDSICTGFPTSTTGMNQMKVISVL